MQLTIHSLKALGDIRAVSRDRRLIVVERHRNVQVPGIRGLTFYRCAALRLYRVTDGTNVREVGRMRPLPMGCHRLRGQEEARLWLDSLAEQAHQVAA
jgi:hypothetical protein